MSLAGGCGDHLDGIISGFERIEELNSVEIKCAVTNRAAHTNVFSRFGLMKRDLDRRSDVQVRDGEKAHPSVTDVDSDSIHMSGIGEHLDRTIPPLAG